MAMDEFSKRLQTIKLSTADREWFPRWVDGYAEHVALKCPQWQRDDSTVPITQELVIEFLRSLRDNGFVAWRRLQACRAIECYQELVRKSSEVDFRPLKSKLQQIERREQFHEEVWLCTAGPTADSPLVCGEGNPGLLPQDDCEVIRKMRGRLRLLHHPKSTEECYLG